MEQIDQIQAKQ